MAGFYNNPTFSAPKPMEELGVYGTQPVPNDYSSLIKALENTKAMAKTSTAKSDKEDKPEKIEALTGMGQVHSQRLIKAENKMAEVQKRYGGDAYVASLDPEFRQAQSDYMMLENPERSNTHRRQEENYKSFQTANKDNAGAFNIDMFNRSLQGTAKDEDVFSYDANGGYRLRSIGEDMDRLENSKDEKYVSNYSYGYKASKGIDDLQTSLNKLYEGIGTSSSSLGQNGVHEVIKTAVLLGGRYGNLKEGYTGASQEDRDNFQQRENVAKRWKEFAYDPTVRDAAMQSLFNTPEGKDVLNGIKMMQQSLIKNGEFKLREIKLDEEGNPIKIKKKDSNGKEYETYETVENTYTEKDLMRKRKEYVDGKVDEHIKNLYLEDNNKRKIEDKKRNRGSKQMTFEELSEEAQHSLRIEAQLMEDAGLAETMIRTAAGDIATVYTDKLGSQSTILYKEGMLEAMDKIRTNMGKEKGYELTVGDLHAGIGDDKYMRSLFAGMGDLNVLAKYAKDAKIGRFISAQKNGNSQFATLGFAENGTPYMNDLLITSQKKLYDKYGLKIQSNPKYTTFDGNNANKVDAYWGASTASSILQELDIKSNPYAYEVAKYMADPNKYIKGLTNEQKKNLGLVDENALTGNYNQDTRKILRSFAAQTGRNLNIVDADGEWSIRKALLANPILYQTAQRATGNSLVARVMLNGIKPEALENVTFKVADEKELELALEDPKVKEAFKAYIVNGKYTESKTYPGFIRELESSRDKERAINQAMTNKRIYANFYTDPTTSINGMPLETYMKSINKWKTKTVKAYDPTMANQSGYDEKGILRKFNDMNGGNVDVNDDGTLNIVGQIEVHRTFKMKPQEIKIGQSTTPAFQMNIQQNISSK